MPPKARAMAERLAEKIARNATTGCHEWTGGRKKDGYGFLWAKGKQQLAHRVSWELANGPVPAGKHLDHLCRNRACVNPAHLEPVTPQENVLRSPIALPAINARKLKCDAGHDLSDDNLDPYAARKRGVRSCVTCARARWRAYYHRRKKGLVA